MSTNKTANIGLHLWEGTDPFLRTEFNENFELIDAAMGTRLGPIEALSSCPVDCSTGVAVVDLSGVEWDKWTFVAVFLRFQPGTYQDEKIVAILEGLTVRGGQLYGPIGSALAVFPCLRDGTRPLRVLLLPGGGVGYSESAYQDVTQLKFSHSGSHAMSLASAEATVWGVR